MNSPAIESFKRGIEEIQQFLIAPPETRKEVSITGFVQILFRAALEHEKISGRCGEDDQVHFQISDAPIVDYEFERGTFRVILAAIASFSRSQTPSLPEGERFNLYGDAQEISCEVNGRIEQFHVETFNDGRKRPFRFTIRHLRA